MLGARPISSSFCVAHCEDLIIFHHLVDVETPIEVSVLDIAIATTVVMHHVDSDIITLLDGSEQIVSRVDWDARDLEVNEGRRTDHLDLHCTCKQLFY